jgi:hypothetical protein
LIATCNIDIAESSGIESASLPQELEGEGETLEAIARDAAIAMGDLPVGDGEVAMARRDATAEDVLRNPWTVGLLGSRDRSQDWPRGQGLAVCVCVPHGVH